jgi:membrane protease YdiL (CAAX protease family)
MGLKPVILLCLLAMGLWTAMFSPPSREVLAFWPMMTLSAGVLAIAALAVGKRDNAGLFTFRRADAAIGIVSPVILYAGFWIAYQIAVRLFGFAAGQVDNIYQLRHGTSPVGIALLLALWIGPAEEIFWRGFVQHRLAARYGIIAGFIAATAIYTLVHIASLNLMLIAAAALCGGFWGLIFAWRKNLWPIILSHAIWDVVIFILWPIGG